MKPPPPVELAYDADVGPERTSWLAAKEPMRIAAVQQHHRTLRSHPAMPNIKLHALMHVVVENQLAAGDPPEVALALARLVAAGVSRHAAVHAIASVVAAEMFTILKDQTTFDRAATAAALARLEAHDWVGR